MGLLDWSRREVIIRIELATEKADAILALYEFMARHPAATNDTTGLALLSSCVM